MNLETKSVKQIEKDIGRTFPTDQSFSRLELKEILIAYSIRNPNVGYCQGLNFIGALLLSFGFSEEEAFWLYTQIIEKYLPYDYFSSMAGILLDQKIFDWLFRSRMEKVSKHLDRLGIESCLFTVQWFICMFAFTFSKDIVKNLWDLIFTQGYQIMHKIGLGAIWVLRKKLLAQKDFVTLLDAFDSGCKEITDISMLLTAINKRNFRIKPSLYQKLTVIIQGNVENEFKERYSNMPHRSCLLDKLGEQCKNDDDCKQKIYVTGSYFTFSKCEVTVLDDFIEARNYSKVVDACYLRELSGQNYLNGVKNHYCSREKESNFMEEFEEDEDGEDLAEFIRRNTAQSVLKSFATIYSQIDHNDLD